MRITCVILAGVTDEFRWPDNAVVDLRDGLSLRDVVEALYAPESLRLDNRVPAKAPTFMAVCAPTDEQRLIIIIICVRDEPAGPWTITGARDALPTERQMWRKYTS